MNSALKYSSDYKCCN